MSDEMNPFAAPQAVDAALPQVEWANNYPEALRRVKRGLSFVYFSIILALLTLLTAVAMPFVMVWQGRPGSEVESITMLALLYAGLMLISFLLMIAGQWFCTAVPEESGAKLLAKMSLYLQFFVFVTWIASLFLGSQVGEMFAVVVAGISCLASLASIVCFSLFMRRVARYIERPDLIGRSTRGLVVAGIAVLLTAGSYIAIWLEPSRVDSLLVGTCFSFGLLLILIAMIMYANMVTYLRKAIVV